MSRHLAVDLGAESGRVVLGTLGDSEITLEELHRFPTQPSQIEGHWRWDVHHIFHEITAACRGLSEEPASIGVCTWGVDFALLAEDGSLLGLPVAYRDDRTEGMMERFFEIVPRETVYAKTGIQFLRLNSLYQLFAIAQNDPEQWKAAHAALFMPDLFHYLLSGEAATEYSFATTTQLLNVNTETWDDAICNAVDAKTRGLLQRIVPPGTALGSLEGSARDATGFSGAVQVVAPASHDTASAVAAIPAEGADWAFISSGTWSLMGMELSAPVCTEAARRYNFTNEGGVGGTIRFLKNIMGLWIVQGCRADFGDDHDYPELMHLATQATPFAALIDPDAEEFFNPDSMTQAISTYCRAREQIAPTSPGAFVRCALESLALRYRQVLDELREVQRSPVNRIHIVGGGSQNELLCQWTANATKLPVLVGPVEATAYGNVIGQAVGTGQLASFEEGRALVRSMTTSTIIEPQDTAAWDEAYERFRTL